jgi:hypothetical protein
MRVACVAGLMTLPVVTLAEIHNMFVGNFRDPYTLHSLAFDDETVELKVTATMEAGASHAWLAFNVCT